MGVYVRRWTAEFVKEFVGLPGIMGMHGDCARDECVRKVERMVYITWHCVGTIFAKDKQRFGNGYFTVESARYFAIGTGIARYIVQMHELH